MTEANPTFNIDEAVRKVLPYMMEMREHFHAHPELSDEEYDTCKTIFQELSLMGAKKVRPHCLQYAKEKSTSGLILIVLIIANSA